MSMSKSQKLQVRHFIAVRLSVVHPTVWMLAAANLRHALEVYIEEEYGIAFKSGTYILTDDEQNSSTYSHPLELIEAEEKTVHEWQITQVDGSHWQASMAEVTCGDNPWDIAHYKEICLQQFRKQYPSKRVRSFVWYTAQGILVTFWQKRMVKRQRRFEVIVRYLVHGPPWPIIEAWNGNYDDLMQLLPIVAPPALK